MLKAASRVLVNEYLIFQMGSKINIMLRISQFLEFSFLRLEFVVGYQHELS